MTNRMYNKIKKDDFKDLQNKMFTLQAILETTSIALYAIQNEGNPGAKAATMSFVLDQAVRLCEQNIETVRDMEELLIVNSTNTEE